MTSLLLAVGVANLIVLLCLGVYLSRRPSPGGADLAPVLTKLEVLDHADRDARQTVTGQFGQAREEARRQAGELRQEVERRVTELGEGIGRRVDAAARESREQQETLRAALDGKLRELREENAKQLAEMRKTVDEKLQSALEKRLGDSFRAVSEQLEQVHRGLGEMQSLASGVGDLKKVLTNVSTRGSWGEVQLRAVLDELLAADQYEENVRTNPNGDERVEFAIRLPGDGDAGAVTLLPIDAKFPKEDYERLVEAEQTGDTAAMETARDGLARAARQNAKTIHDKYVAPPHTTGFAVMYLPTESLFAEVVRRPGLVETLQRESRIIVAGPTNMAALLNSLQMGFRTLALQRRSNEVWEILAGVKTEFGRFGDALGKIRRTLHAAVNHVDKIDVRTRAMERELRDVEALPDARTQHAPALPPDNLDEETEPEPPTRSLLDA